MAALTAGTEMLTRVYMALPVSRQDQNLSAGKIKPGKEKTSCMRREQMLR